MTYLNLLSEPTEEEREIVAVREYYGRALYLAGRLDEADSVFHGLEVPPLVERVLGCRLNGAKVAARRGNEQAASQMTECFGDPAFMPRSSSAEIWKARIPALLGHREEAVRHLSSWATESGQLGLTYMVLHRDFDLLTLQGYPPFEELLRPKG